MSNRRTQRLAFSGLLGVSITWGTTFPLSKTLFQRMSVWDLLALRFGVAALVMMICFYPFLRRLRRTDVIRGAGLGFAYGAAQIVANLGLERAPAGVAGFITGTYVVLTPLCAALMLKVRLGARAWLAAGIAAVGLGVLAVHGFSIGRGEALALASALIYAVHIVVLGRFTTARNAIGLAVVQIAATALVCVATALVVQHRITLPSNGFDWSVIVYMALVSGALAMIVQSWAQVHMAAARVAVVMATEPVWAAGLSVLFLHEPLTWRLLVGGGLIVSGLIVSESSRASPAEAPTSDATAAEKATPSMIEPVSTTLPGVADSRRPG